jgi:hypothetical protein
MNSHARDSNSNSSGRAEPLPGEALRERGPSLDSAGAAAEHTAPDVIRSERQFMEQCQTEWSIAGNHEAKHSAQADAPLSEKHQASIVTRGGPLLAWPMTRASAYPTATMSRTIASARSDAQEIKSPPDV